MSEVQYVIIKNRAGLKYSRGEVVAQGVHAAVQCLFTYDDGVVRRYVDRGKDMVTVVLGGSDEEIEKVVEELDKNQIKYVRWIEQPENELTAVALYPLDKKNPARSILKHLKLLK